MKKNITFRYVIAVLLISFALITLFVSSSVIFDWFGIRENKGNYVPFVVLANLTAGLLYIIGAFGLLKSKKWTVLILTATAGLLFLALIGMFVHINLGGNFEIKTLGTMVFRISLTIGFALHAHYTLRNFETATAF